ncbi:hypothetical protein, partial [Meiothermus cerbereus]|uniref:hypothetical protein n=1 Tax=Meiothermus cerbereus TaxID=65552 RepID=UPI002FD8E57D
GRVSSSPFGDELTESGITSGQAKADRMPGQLLAQLRVGPQQKDISYEGALLPGDLLNGLYRLGVLEGR